MKVTIIPDDGKVGVDGEFRDVDLSDVDPSIHAVQWNGNAGHIEFKDGSENEPLKNFGQFQSLVGRWQTKGPPPTPPLFTLPTPAESAELNLTTNTVQAAMLRRIAALEGKTPRQVIDEIKAELSA